MVNVGNAQQAHIYFRRQEKLQHVKSALKMRFALEAIN